MKFYNLKHHHQQVSFIQAVSQGLGKDQGLFFPLEIPEFSPSKIDELLAMENPFDRHLEILNAFIGDELPPRILFGSICWAFSFPAILHSVQEDCSCLELFHGPTVAFKDFGARFMAQILQQISRYRAEQQYLELQRTYGEDVDPPPVVYPKLTILTATSGDTGAAVADAFYEMENVNVVVLYPRGKISLYQEKLFCTMGENIHTIAIDGDFDDCQALVKQAFDDQQLVSELGLNSANSINISRLLAQICYYFEAVAQLPAEQRSQLVISVPSGNFGNLTAGLMAKAMGLPVKRFIAATNSNDTVPRYLSQGKWQPKPTIATLSNAMDVSQPNNWQRIEELFRRKQWQLSDLAYASIDEDTTRASMRELYYKMHYLSEPHAAVAWRALRDNLAPGEYGIFLGTADFGKFKDTVDKVLDQCVPLADPIVMRLDLPILSVNLPADYATLRQFLLEKLPAQKPPADQQH